MDICNAAPVRRPYQPDDHNPPKPLTAAVVAGVFIVAVEYQGETTANIREWRVRTDRGVFVVHLRGLPMSLGCDSALRVGRVDYEVVAVTPVAELCASQVFDPVV